MNNDTKVAWVLAEKYHAGQKYGKEDYTYHLHLVQESVKSCNYDERLQVVAILHDILEDTACPKAVLDALFEDKIVEAVVALTKVKGQTPEAYKAAVKANAMALEVKQHDALCNLVESLRRGDKRRVSKYANLLKELAE